MLRDQPGAVKKNQGLQCQSLQLHCQTIPEWLDHVWQFQPQPCQTTVSEPFVGVSSVVAGIELLLSRMEASEDLTLRPLVGLPLPLSVASAGKLVCPRSL